MENCHVCRYNSSGHVKAEYVYTYDAGDNMVTKVEPFLDDFNDGAYTGWTVVSGTWSASSNYLTTTTSSGAISKATTDGDTELRFRFMDTNTGLNNSATIYARFNESNWSYLYLRITPSQLQLMQYSGGAYTTFDTNTSATTTSNTWYNYRIVCDGATVKVYRNVDGALEQQVLSTSSATVTTTQDVRIGVWSNHHVDDIRILADDLTNTTTFTMDNANELSTMTDPDGTTTFGFDAWGRTSNKSLGSFSAAYGYKYGQMLCSVTSNWPGEGNVTYDYGGNLQRRERTVASTTTKFRWNGSIDLMNEEDSSGNLTRTYVGRLADVAGSNPATGTVRLVSDGSAAVIAEAEYTPYGGSLIGSGATSMWSFAMLGNDSPSGMMFAPFVTFGLRLVLG